jgi:hypothetical protein
MKLATKHLTQALAYRFIRRDVCMGSAVVA